MNDEYGRNIHYLRLSVTDLCNLRCTYCMPEKGVPKLKHEDILSVDEIEEIVAASVKCGIDKIRLTGGEPLIRKGIIEICSRIHSIDGIKEICMTTNGLLLKDMAEDLHQAGVNRLNLSLDTLNREKFARITRHDKFDKVIAGIEAAKKAGFEHLKINAVLIGGVNDDEIPAMVELTKNDPIQMRFIELMPIGECSHWDEKCFLPNKTVLERVPALEHIGIEGVANVYRIPGYKGTVGLISPINNHFCPECNRIRVTADGKLKTCLHSRNEVMLRGLHGEELEKTISEAILLKPQRHHLSATSPSATQRNMNQIGG